MWQWRFRVSGSFEYYVLKNQVEHVNSIKNEQTASANKDKSMWMKRAAKCIMRPKETLVR